MKDMMFDTENTKITHVALVGAGHLIADAKYAQSLVSEMQTHFAHHEKVWTDYDALCDVYKEHWGRSNECTTADAVHSKLDGIAAEVFRFATDCTGSCEVLSAFFKSHQSLLNEVMSMRRFGVATDLYLTFDVYNWLQEVYASCLLVSLGALEVPHPLAYTVSLN